jgi:hypothetical protein
MSTIKNSGGSFSSTRMSVLGSDQFPLIAGSPLFGRGIDGDITVSSSINLYTSRTGSNAVKTRTVDAPVATVTAISGTTLSVTVQTGLIGDFKQDDVCLIANLQGDVTNNSNVGNYDLVKLLTDGASGQLTLVSALTKNFGVGGNSDLTGQKICIIRLPEFKNVTVSTGGVITASAWNGTFGGIVSFFAQALTQSGTGVISANSLGYRGASAAGGSGEGYAAGRDTVGTSAVGSGGGGGGTTSASPTYVGVAGTPATTATPATVIAGPGGGGGGGAGGGAGGGGGHGATGGVGGLGGGGGGGGGGVGVWTAPVGRPNTFGGNASTSTGGTLGTAAQGSPGFQPSTSSNYGNGGTGMSGSPTAAAAGLSEGTSDLGKIFLGGGGGAAGNGAVGAAGGAGGVGSSPPVGVGVGGVGGGGGGGGGGFGVVPGGAGGALGLGNTAPVNGAAGSNGSASTAPASTVGGAGGGIVLVFAQAVTGGSFKSEGVAGVAGNPGGAGGNGGSANPFGGTMNGGSGGGGGGGGGSGGGAGGSVYVFGKTLVTNSPWPAIGGLGGTGGGAGAGGGPAPTTSYRGGTGAAGLTGGNGSGGRVKAVYFTNDGTYASASADGPSPSYAPAGPISGSGYKQSL